MGPGRYPIKNTPADCVGTALVFDLARQLTERTTSKWIVQRIRHSVGAGPRKPRYDTRYQIVCEFSTHDEIIRHTLTAPMKLQEATRFLAGLLDAIELGFLEKSPTIEDM